MSNVVKFPGETLLDLNPDDILEDAKGKLEKVVVIGYTTDGAEYFDSNFADGMIAVWLLERIKLLLLSVVDDEMEEDE